MDEHTIWNEFGNIYTMLGHLESAAEAFHKAIELAPDFSLPYKNLGLCYYQQGKYGEALAQYQISLELSESEKEKALCLERLGEVYARLGDYLQSANAYHQASNLKNGENPIAPDDSIDVNLLNQDAPSTVPELEDATLEEARETHKQWHAFDESEMNTWLHDIETDPALSSPASKDGPDDNAAVESPKITSEELAPLLSEDGMDALDETIQICHAPDEANEYGLAEKSALEGLQINVEPGESEIDRFVEDLRGLADQMDECDHVDDLSVKEGLDIASFAQNPDESVILEPVDIIESTAELEAGADGQHARVPTDKSVEIDDENGISEIPASTGLKKGRSSVRVVFHPKEFSVRAPFLESDNELVCSIDGEESPATEDVVQEEEHHCHAVEIEEYNLRESVSDLVDTLAYEPPLTEKGTSSSHRGRDDAWVNQDGLPESPSFANDAQGENRAQASIVTQMTSGMEVGEQKSDLKESVAIYKRITHLAPTNDKAWDKLGNLYKDLRQYEEAQEAYEKAVSIAPTQLIYSYHLGLVYTAQKQYEQAVSTFQKVLELDSDYVLAHCAMAGCFRRLGLDEEAEEHITIARPHVKSESEYNQACFEAICGNTESAIKLLEIAIENEQTTLEWIRDDPDLDFIRDEPGFQELIGKEDLQGEPKVRFL